MKSQSPDIVKNLIYKKKLMKSLQLMIGERSIRTGQKKLGHDVNYLRFDVA